MIEHLLIGLPGERPGGLVLTVALFAGSAGGAVALGYVYAALNVVYPRAALAMQGVTAILRGVPLLLLAFLLVNLPGLSARSAGLLALVLYSFSHSGEILRGFLAAYPRPLAEQARIMGVAWARDWLELRLRWTFKRALPALLTHWVSLLKDTGALVVLGIGELTTVVKLLGESSRDLGDWTSVLCMGALLYLVATLSLINLVQRLAQGATPHGANDHLRVERNAI